MTITRHGHHIPGTELTDEAMLMPERCGGIVACEICKFEVQWRTDYDAKKAIIMPSEVASLDSVVLTNIAAKLRTQNEEPKRTMRIAKYQLNASIYALADAIDGVAKDMSVS